MLWPCEQLLEARGVALARDAAEVRALLRVVAVELADLARQDVDEALRHLAVHQHVVGRDAGLPGVDELAPGDARGGHLEVGALVDQARALAAQLERDRREVLGCRGHHHLGHALVTGVEDVVEALLEQLGGLGDAALDHRERVLVEVARQDRRDRRGGVRGDLGGLHHRAVARGDGADQRRGDHRQRVVPRRDDQHHALGLGPDVAAPGLRHDRRAHPLRPHPGGQVLARVLHLGLDEIDLGHAGLEPALAEVEPQRLGEVGLVFAQHAVEFGQLGEPPLDGQGLAGVERLSQPGQRALQRCTAHGKSPASVGRDDRSG